MLHNFLLQYTVCEHTYISMVLTYLKHENFFGKNSQIQILPSVHNWFNMFAEHIYSVLFYIHVCERKINRSKCVCARVSAESSFVVPVFHSVCSDVRHAPGTWHLRKH